MPLGISDRNNILDVDKNKTRTRQSIFHIKREDEAIREGFEVAAQGCALFSYQLQVAEK